MSRDIDDDPFYEPFVFIERQMQDCLELGFRVHCNFLNHIFLFQTFWVSIGFVEKLLRKLLVRDQRWFHMRMGQAHCLALLKDGRLYAWGNNPQGQVGNGALAKAQQQIRGMGQDVRM